MLIENMMYFVLGALLAGLIALVMLPAVWKRAVRLTKRRIEAATPITMAEFRADKDQLRAEFALTTRRLEMTIDTLRKRLAEQLGDFNQKRSELGAMHAERETHSDIVKEFESRESSLRERGLELEREVTNLAQRLRMQERAFEQREIEFSKVMQTAGEPSPGPMTQVDDAESHRTRSQQHDTALEESAYRLLHTLEQSETLDAVTTSAIAQMRQILTASRSQNAQSDEFLQGAQDRISNAENQFSTLMTQVAATDVADHQTGQSLADQLSLEANIEKLRLKVEAMESAIMSDWGTDRAPEAQLRACLVDIARSVGKTVQAKDQTVPTLDGYGESLFDRVQRYAQGDPAEDFPGGVEQPSKAAGKPMAVQETQPR